MDPHLTDVYVRAGQASSGMMQGVTASTIFRGSLGMAKKNLLSELKQSISAIHNSYRCTIRHCVEIVFDLTKSSEARLVNLGLQVVLRCIRGA